MQYIFDSFQLSEKLESLKDKGLKSVTFNGVRDIKTADKTGLFVFAQASKVSRSAVSAREIKDALSLPVRQGKIRLSQALRADSGSLIVSSKSIP